MEQYLNTLEKVLEDGHLETNRTGIPAIRYFGLQQRYDISKSFPLLTTKKILWKSVVHELLWFLRGDEDTSYLHDHNIHFWDKWAFPDGSVGPSYGSRWRKWGGDQIANVIKEIREFPQSRRLIVSAWDADRIGEMALPPCHAFFQFYVEQDEYLSCQLYQRSCDLPIGVPFNIASYSLLTYMVAQVCGLKPRNFIHTMGDAHIYCNQVDGVLEQLSREPKAPPSVLLNPSITHIDDFTYDSIELHGYNCHPFIKMPVAV